MKNTKQNSSKWWKYSRFLL